MVIRCCALALALATSAAVAFDCPEPTRDAAGDGYRKRAGDYCDGVISIGFSGRPQLIGYSQGDLGPLVTELVLRLPETTLQPPFLVQGVAKNASVAYRMDARLANADVGLSIGSDAALFTSRRVKPADVVFGSWSEGSEKQKKTWLPVRVGDGGILRVFVRTSEPLASIDVRLDGDVIPAPRGEFESNQVITIELPAMKTGHHLLSILTRPSAEGAKNRVLEEAIWIPRP